MAKLFDMVKVNIPTTGQGTVTFGAATSNTFLTPPEAGALDGDQPRYRFQDGLDFEEGVGGIGSSVSQMTRTVTRSKIGGVVGTTKINLSGSAVLAFIASAADILNPANNLSDLASASTARTNLGLGDVAVKALADVFAFSNATEATGAGTTYGARFAGGVEFAKKMFVTGAAAFASTLAVAGAINANSTSDATSVAAGGAFTSAGGGAFAKKLFVGDTLTCAVPPVFTDQSGSRAALYAAPFDALAYNGMQVNGSIDIGQELGPLSASALTSTASMKYIADNWGARFKSSGFALTAEQVPSSTFACPPGFKNSIRLKASTGGALGSTDYAFVSTFIEGNRAARLDLGKSTAQSFTIGFWVNATIAGTMSVAALNGPGSRKIGVAVVINNPNTWEYKTVTIAGDTTSTGWTYDNTLGLQLNFGFGEGATEAAVNTWSGSGSTFGGLTTTNFFATTNNAVYITGVIVVPGTEIPASARSSYIMRPAEQELLLAQRLYETSYDAGVLPGAVSSVGEEFFSTQMSSATYAFAGSGARFKTAKRTTPTITGYSPTTGASGKMRDLGNSVDANATIDHIGQRGFRWFGAISPASSVGAVSMHWAGDARF